MCAKKVLYLGLDPSRYKSRKKLVHYPIITIEKRPLEGKIKEHFQNIASFSVILLTSRTAASLFFEYCERVGASLKDLSKKLYITVGGATAEKVPHGFAAKEECGEGVIALLKNVLYLKKRPIFFPHSAASRPLLVEYLRSEGYFFIDLITYEPKVTEEALLYDLEEFDEIVFTSPSTVHAFFEKKYKISEQLELTTIGPITHNALLKYINPNSG